VSDNFLAKLSRYLFWDSDINMLDPNIDRSLIMERVFSMGTENDEKEVVNYYGKTLIQDTVPNIKYLDKKTLNYLSIFYDIPKEKFRCYERSLLKDPFGIC